MRQGLPVLALLLAGCGGASTNTARPQSAAGPAGPVPAASAADRANVERLERALADDSMEGRYTASRGEDRASRFLASEMKRIGLVPGGDRGSYLQDVPLRANPSTHRLSVVLDRAAFDTIPAAERRIAHNVIGIIRGRDPALKAEVILVLSHYDHLGIAGQGSCRAMGRDSICNGADDDASGTVAVLESARHLMQGEKPRRTVVFATMTGEEIGTLGTRYFIAHPVVPLNAIVAGLEIEMIARPDSLVGGPGEAWLTGYERSTMGDMLKANGIAIIPDPRPAANFFFRSDNVVFAQMGIVAHTLSTFNNDGVTYHHPNDDVTTINFGHLTAVVASAAMAVRHLADDPEKPAWHPGGRPAPRAGRGGN